MFNILLCTSLYFWVATPVHNLFISITLRFQLIYHENYYSSTFQFSAINPFRADVPNLCRWFSGIFRRHKIQTLDKNRVKT